MNEIIKNTIYFILITSTLLSCRSNILEDPVIVANVETEFYIDMWETLEVDRRTFSFSVETIEEENCLNHIIDTEIEQTNESISLLLKGVLEPEDCQAGNAPAITSVDLGVLPDGLYDLNISIQDALSSTGHLLVNEAIYRIILGSEDGFSLLNKNLLRVPDRAIWGYVVYNGEQYENIALDFLDKLGALVSPIDLTDGNYGYFTKSNTSPILNITDHPDTINIKSFVYSLDTEVVLLETLIANYRENYPDQIEIKLTNWLGQEL